MDTITALSTPIGQGGISIIRVSGTDSRSLVSNLFADFDIFKAEPRYMYLKTISINGIIDKCLVVYFQSPNSFTGEDVVEFHLHGGAVLSKILLDKLIENGCRMANPGEFSMRAFINGKSSLDKLEGIIDIINSQSEKELLIASSLSQGKLSNKILELQTTLISILAEIEVTLDYPEHDIDYSQTKSIIQNVNIIKNSILDLLQTVKLGKIIKSGVNIALIGTPNSGKSSLMNAMLGYDRAIVTDIAGTTRDIIEDSYIYNKTKFNLIDTAGIHQSNDKIEKIGIEKSYKILNDCDIVLFIVDSSKDLTDEDREILSYIKSHKLECIIVLSKNDIKLKNHIFDDHKCIEVSSIKNYNIDNLKNLIYDKTINKFNNDSYFIITNIRHIELLNNALNSLNNISKNNLSLEIIALDVKNAVSYLNEITGLDITNELLNNIFSKFCLGK